MPDNDAHAASAPQFNGDLRAAVELLRATVTNDTGGLDQWQAVYGTLLSGLPDDVVDPMAHRVAKSFEQVRSSADLPDAVRALTREVVDVLSREASRLLSTTAIAHVALEKKLLEDVAVATGRPIDDVLAQLDIWISDLEVDE
ncbi:hypothetical protein CU254_42415 (plasmid) [Amycolatopsis sp. AA4]|uniref:hypothetical protein n=1 Tax=Actinomycetes TaxID=1760 RepID=UPI0005683086|nr:MULTISPECIES: hypothetical protein [Actinomycetes]ATY17243.1 hypothetical protein CU254_42415 [Amycolatopsis sp. AA4]